MAHLDTMQFRLLAVYPFLGGRLGTVGTEAPIASANVTTDTAGPSWFSMGLVVHTRTGD